MTNVKGLEVWYAWISQLYILLLTGVSAYNYDKLIRPFLQEKRYSCLIGTTYFGVCIGLFFLKIPYVDHFWIYALGSFAALIVMLGMDWRNQVQKIFLAVTFFSLRWLIFSIVRCFQQIFYYESQKFPYYWESQKMQFVLYTIGTFLQLLLCFGLMRLFVYLITKYYVYRKENIIGKEALMLSIPSITAILGNRILLDYEAFYQNSSANTMFDHYGRFTWMSLAFYICFIFSILTVILLFQHLKGKQEENKRKELLQREMTNMRKHMKETEQLYQEIRRLRHDIGSHIMVLESLVVGGEEEEAKNYLLKLKQEFHRKGLEIKSGNPITDVILIQKKKEAKAQNIRFISEFYYYEDLKIDVFDLSIILNNAIGNAIEAAKECEEGYIVIRSFRKNGIYMMEFHNSYCGEILVDEEHGFLQTTKKDGHGLGLSNMRAIAQKYQGEMELEYNGKEFVLYVMLVKK